MPDVRLRAMRADEFDAYQRDAIAGYADTKVRAGDWTSAEALARSAQKFGELLPDGVATEGTLLRVAERDDGMAVGTLFLALTGPRGGDAAYIYNIEVAEAHRGRGYGRALLEAAGAEVAARGIATIELNVFGDNTVARSLYESAGYETVAVAMRRHLTAD